jgi:hypothetical protein
MIASAGIIIVALFVWILWLITKLDDANSEIDAWRRAADEHGWLHGN